jgi:hypothetical protein
MGRAIGVIRSGNVGWPAINENQNVIGISDDDGRGLAGDFSVNISELKAGLTEESGGSYQLTAGVGSLTSVSSRTH